ncbi:MAG: hypothetical protein NWE92_13550 [Candidatus Bathyarchaeota archaeon]|nr:hypothetical protein [Candidatus Bathyarchaeota archaeon]
MQFPRSVKLCLIASLLSLTGYVLYQAIGGYVILYGYFTGVASWVHYVSFLGPAFWASLVGINSRLAGCLVGLGVVFLLWRKSRSFSQVKKPVACALVLESLYFVSIIPNMLELLDTNSFLYNAPLGVGYLFQVCFTVPLLWLLAYKVAAYNQPTQKQGLLKFAALAFVGYAVALTANEVSRWTSMISAETLTFIQGINAVGFFNAWALMPFSVVFAVVGAYRLFQQKIAGAMRWFGASLLVIGLNYTIYLGFTYAVGALNTLPLVDIWAVPLLALGAALVAASRSQKS